MKIIEIEGKTRVRRLIFGPKLSQSAQINSRIVKRDKAPIYQNLFWSFKNCVPTKPKDSKSEITTKRRRLLIFEP